VQNLGGIGTLVKVAPGYARNYLLPLGMARIADKKNKRQFEHELRRVGFLRNKARQAAEEVAKRLSGVTVTIARKVGEQDKLYGSVTAHDVQEGLKAQHKIDLDRRKVDLHEPIKALGTYEVAARLPGDIKAKIKVAVVAE
jgi:large subunit ribosomal protein L9